MLGGTRNLIYILPLFFLQLLLTQQLSQFNQLLYFYSTSPPSSSIVAVLSNDPGKVDSNFFCYVATVLSPHRNVLIFTQRMHKPT